MSVSNVPLWMVPVVGRLEPIDRLPLWAKVLLCERIVRRAAMALLAPASPDADAARVCLAGCDLAARCAAAGTLLPAWRGELEHLMELGQAEHAPATLAATRWLLDAALGAEMESDFGGAAGTVSRSVWSAVAALGRDPRLPQLQMLLLLGADADQLAFACTEAGVQTDGAMRPEVLGRIAPVHALTLVEVHPTPEDLAR